VIRFDHIAIAAPRLADAPAVLVGKLGGAPAYGAPSGPYRFYQWRFANLGRIEVLEPMGAESFLHRFLAQRGPGVHHVTFKVPSLADTCARAEARGYEIVGRNESDPEWKEAFLHPRQAMGIVVQFAETRWSGDDGLPDWPPPPGPPNPPPAVAIVGLRLRARSAERARVQWEEIAGGERIGNVNGEIGYHWPGSPMRLAVEMDPAGEEGPIAIEYASDRPVAVAPGPDPVLGVVFRPAAG
jgi:glyoxalase/bleomycin resistance protein/dioxygenase superfamily protein